jgi:hypothetical protein
MHAAFIKETCIQNPKHKYNIGTQILYMYRKLITYIRMWKASNNKTAIEMIADKCDIEYATDVQYYPWRKLCNKNNIL